LLYHRISIRGLDEMKKFLASRGGRPVILAANHQSYLDPPAIGMVFPTPLRFIAWDGLFRIPLLGAMIRALGAVPVSQENKNAAAGLLRDVMGFVRDGYSVLIFPEGQRTPDGRLQPFEGGVALIALKMDVPVVPIWIEGAFDAFPISRRFPRPRKIAVTFGEPLLPERIADMPEKNRRQALLGALESALVSMRDGVRQGF
jgi:1-acyl-sn-glycerol-3-phosphate acyltransferase